MRPHRPEPQTLAARAIAACVVVLWGALGVAAPRPTRADELRPFEAAYDWSFKGMTVAVSTLKLEHDDGDRWTYSSRSEPRGLGRLFSQRPVMRSVMRVTGDQVQPLEYHADAGNGSTSRNADLKFDWAAARVTGTYEDTKVDLPLKPGVQDDLSVQIGMLVQLLQGHTPDNLAMVDKNEVREYRYGREREETIDTPIGRVATVVYTSQRAGSPRITRFWCAPDKGFIPLRVEQRRQNDVEWRMDIQSLNRP
jgi:hypothetical protein